jgi:large subunit ribosomal protein L17
MLQRNLVTSVLLYESIRTTKKRAEVVQPQIEKIITIAKTKAPYVAIRAINAVVTDKNACRKTMEVLKDRFAARSSGYTRMVALGQRHGDGAKMVTLELVGGKMEAEKKPEARNQKSEDRSQKTEANKTSAKKAK